MNYENLISIVMPVFNAQAYLEEALESVRRQTWTDWELLVVDDHSTDGMNCGCLLVFLRL